VITKKSKSTKRQNPDEIINTLKGKLKRLKGEVIE